MKYFDKHNTEIHPGMEILCLIDSSTEQVYEADNGELGIMGDPLEDLPPVILPLHWFAYEQNEDGYVLYHFEILHDIAS